MREIPYHNARRMQAFRAATGSMCRLQGPSMRLGEEPKITVVTRLPNPEIDAQPGDERL